MKLEKKHWILIGVVIAVILVWYFFLRKKKSESSFTLSKRIPGTNIAYDYSYPLPQNQQNCGLGCKYWLGFCWCLKYKSYTPVGNCPAGQHCVDKDMYGNCIKCATFGD